jgi:hypothetical protein
MHVCNCLVQQKQKSYSGIISRHRFESSNQFLIHLFPDDILTRFSLFLNACMQLSGPTGKYKHHYITYHAFSRHRFEFSFTHLFPYVRQLVPRDVDRGRVVRPRPDLCRRHLRHVLGAVDDDRVGNGAVAVWLGAHVVEHLHLDLVGGPKVLAVDADHVEANVAQLFEGALLKVTLQVDADATVVDSGSSKFKVYASKLKVQITHFKDTIEHLR